MLELAVRCLDGTSSSDSRQECPSQGRPLFTAAAGPRCGL